MSDAGGVSRGGRTRILFFGAHPDDADLMCGGTAALLAAAGHVVRFVSMTDGRCGHHRMEPGELAERRRREARASAAAGGVASYEVWDLPDGGLEPTLENRMRVVRAIRRAAPDVVISHRTCDYHADHRAAGRLALDAASLVKAPLCCPDTPVPPAEPVFAACHDVFTDPRPARLDAVVPLDGVVETKVAMLCCHESQFFEWLPWDYGETGFDPVATDRPQWIRDHWLREDQAVARAAGAHCRYAEAFELSPYGRQVSLKEFQSLFTP